MSGRSILFRPSDQALERVSGQISGSSKTGRCDGCSCWVYTEQGSTGGYQEAGLYQGRVHQAGYQEQQELTGKVALRIGSVTGPGRSPESQESSLSSLSRKAVILAIPSLFVTLRNPHAGTPEP